MTTLVLSTADRAILEAEEPDTHNHTHNHSDSLTYAQQLPENAPVSTCLDFPDSFNSAVQLQAVEDNPNCAEKFVQEMIDKPAIYLDAFYALIESEKGSDALWWAVFQQVRADEFRFPGAVVDDLHTNLMVAIEGCSVGDSCDQWRTFILPALDYGELYRCPDLDGLANEEILAAVPYGDFYCIEALAEQLGNVATFQDMQYLIDGAKQGEIPWGRRNAIRIIGRLAERPESDAIQVLVSQMLSTRIIDLMLDRLAHDPSEDVLLDAIWILDSVYHPTFAAQSELESITKDAQASPELRFRAMASVTRLIQEKEWLRSGDMIFLQKSLKSSDPWVRGYAAFAMQSLQNITIRSFQERQITTSLENAYTSEQEFSTKAAIAQALDNYSDSELLVRMKIVFEREKLAQNLSEDHISVRSGLNPEEIPPKLARMRGIEKAFFDVFEEATRTPTPESTDASLELLLFATQSDYQEYMDAFVGYGSDAGGLYLESDSTLYTYERTDNESRYTVEHLIQHEFTHYLMGRYVFPGLWSDPDYHQEPKGWIDEGTAEYFAELEVDEQGQYSMPPSSERLAELCDSVGNQSLQSLLTQRAGYDQPGTFSYDLAWSFVKYLIDNHPGSAQSLLKAFRDGTYRLEDFSTVTGFPTIEAIESTWRQDLSQQCAALVLNTGGPTSELSLEELSKDPTSATGPKRYDEPAATTHGHLEHEIISIREGEPTPSKFGGRQLAAPPPPTENDTQSERFIRLIAGD